MEISSTFGPIDIAISGMRAQNKQIEVITSNTGNIHTTDNGSGEPYRRIEAIFKSNDDGISGVSLDKVAKDMSDFHRILKPGHPDADENGYVMMPNVDLATEMINLNIASRAYQANVAILKRYQKMVETTLELLR
ncbi:MAG: flagellar basal body rod protein FlgC [Planctomycetota bacterium]|jgi:flagellar basal-body rod protein FlgC